MNNQMSPIGYKGEVNVYDGKGVHWVNGEMIGRMLYDDEPRQRVIHTYFRNKHHFTEKDTLLAKVPMFHTCDVDTTSQPQSKITQKKINITQTCGVNMTPQVSSEITQKREVRFFSLPYGALKLCQFSNSERAPYVTEHILNAWEAVIKGKLTKPEPSLALIAEKQTWTRGNGEKIKELAAKSERFTNNVPDHLKDKKGVSEMTVRRRVARVRAGEPVNKRVAGLTVRFVYKENREKIVLFFNYLEKHPYARLWELVEAADTSMATASRWKKISGELRERYLS